MDRTKQRLRETMILARSRLCAGDRASFAHAISLRVVALEAFEHALTLAVYAPMGAEVDTAEIARAAAARGKRVAYPRLVAGERVLAFAVCGEDSLRPGVLGAREPPADAPDVPLNEIDLAIVPGVAFDGRGQRLGRGRGHYDATLAMLSPRASRVGLAFEVQIVPAVPHEDHDVALDAVVTEAATRFRVPGGAARAGASR